MSLEEPWTRKCLSTNITLVVEVVSENMHGQGWHTHIQFVANMALLGGVRVKSSVSLLVPRQVTARCIVLTAFGAGVFRFGGFWTDRDILRSSITRKEGLICVSGGLAAVQSKNWGIDITGGVGGG